MTIQLITECFNKSCGDFRVVIQKEQIIAGCMADTQAIAAGKAEVFRRPEVNNWEK